MVTPKKLGKAVLRNRIRRRLMSIFSKIRHKIGKNLDIVLYPRQAVAAKPYQALAAEVARVFEQKFNEDS